jgi:hypothetical protein
MNWHELIAVGKYASAISAALFGAIGLFGEKQKDGRLTRVGRVALVGFIFSAVIGVVTSWAEQEDETADRTTKQAQLQADLDWQRKTLTSIQRQLYSFSSLTAGVHFKIPEASPLFKVWTATLDNYLSSIPEPHGKLVTADNGATSVVFSAGGHDAGRPQQVIVTRDSPLFHALSGTGNCLRPELFLMVSKQRPSLDDAKLDALMKAADLAIFYPREYTAESVTYNLLDESLIYNLHTQFKGAEKDDGEVISLLDFKDKYVLVASTVDPIFCTLSWIRLDAPGTLGKSDSRAADFDVTPITVEGGSAALHKIEAKDFPLRALIQGPAAQRN